MNVIDIWPIRCQKLLKFFSCFEVIFFLFFQMARIRKFHP